MRLLSTVFYVTLLVWAAMELRQALRRRPGATDEDRGSLAFVRFFALMGAVGAAFAAKFTRATFAHGEAVVIATILVVWAGIALRWWCFHTLGRYFTFTVMTSPDQKVITSGPYRFVRHPSYTAILVILAGIGLSYGNWLSLVVLLALSLVGFVHRIQVEEAALAGALGSAYTSYAAGRKRLVPFVW